MVKEYICECCNKKWADKTAYNTHLNRKKFTGEPIKKKSRKPEICEQCKKHFTTNWHLVRHYKNFPEIHSNELIGLGIEKYNYPDDYKKEYKIKYTPIPKELQKKRGPKPKEGTKKTYIPIPKELQKKRGPKPKEGTKKTYIPIPKELQKKRGPKPKNKKEEN